MPGSHEYNVQHNFNFLIEGLSVCHISPLEKATINHCQGGWADPSDLGKC